LHMIVTSNPERVRCVLSMYPKALSAALGILPAGRLLGRTWKYCKGNKGRSAS
jgi:hypothetical protein